MIADFLTRLQQFLDSRSESPQITQLTPDASTREYFRIGWQKATAIACVYPEPFVARDQNYLDVTGLFLKCGLPVAEIYEFDEALGIIVLEDFGNVVLRDVLESSDEAERNALLNDAVSLIARIQAATDTAFESGSVASKLRFDTAKLLWELEFFKTHYFGTLRKQPLPPAVDAAVSAEFRELSEDLESRAAVLCHRDFHAANLMLDRNGRLRIIDHQDARIGSASYDLVSLLLDRVTVPPTPVWLADKRDFLLTERERIGLSPLDREEFAEEFRLQTVQRCLKAVGTFSFQSVNRGKNYFLPYIEPMFHIVIRALDKVDRFPNLRKELQKQV